MNKLFTSLFLIGSISLFHAQLTQDFESLGSPCFGNNNLPGGADAWTQLCSNNLGTFTSDCTDANNWIWINSIETGPCHGGTHALNFAASGTAAQPANTRYLISPQYPSVGPVTATFWLKTTSSASCGDRKIELLWSSTPATSVTDGTSWAAWDGALTPVGFYEIPADPSCTSGCVGSTENWVEVNTAEISPGTGFYLVWRYNYSTNNNCVVPIWIDDISIDPTVTVDETSVSGSPELSIYPNPVTGDVLNLRIEDEGNTPVIADIHDLSGRLVFHSKPLMARQNLLSLSLAEMAIEQGSYRCTITLSSGKTVSMAFVVTR